VERGFVVDYRDVLGSPAEMDEMLGHSNGARRVPVIVEDKTVTVGHGGT
jgi:hypothetical protein